MQNQNGAKITVDFDTNTVGDLAIVHASTLRIQLQICQIIPLFSTMFLGYKRDIRKKRDIRRRHPISPEYFDPYHDLDILREGHNEYYGVVCLPFYVIVSVGCHPNSKSALAWHGMTHGIVVPSVSVPPKSGPEARSS